MYCDHQLVQNCSQKEGPELTFRGKFMMIWTYEDSWIQLLASSSVSNDQPSMWQTYHTWQPTLVRQEHWNNLWCSKRLNLLSVLRNFTAEPGFQQALQAINRKLLGHSEMRNSNLRWSDSLDDVNKIRTLDTGILTPGISQPEHLLLYRTEGVNDNLNISGFKWSVSSSVGKGHTSIQLDKVYAEIGITSFPHNENFVAPYTVYRSS